jgi:hypothetical protein
VNRRDNGEAKDFLSCEVSLYGDMSRRVTFLRWGGSTEATTAKTTPHFSVRVVAGSASTVVVSLVAPSC